MKKLTTLIIIFFISFACISLVQAADLSVVAPQGLRVGSSFSVEVLVSTDQTAINSVDIGIAYPTNLLTFKGYQEHGGVINIWLAQPMEKDGVISFTGIIPGGVEGSYNSNQPGVGPVPLVKLLFEAKKAGLGELSIKHSSVLINDGRGSPLVYDIKNTSINIADRIEQEIINADKSTPNNIPDPFTISLINPGFFSRTPLLLIFSSSDALSGIKKYEMTTDGGFHWVEVASPVPLNKSFFDKEVTIRATNYNDNIQDASVTVPGFIPISLSVFLIFLLLIFGYSRFLWYKKRR